MGVWNYIRRKVLPAAFHSEIVRRELAKRGVPTAVLDTVGGVVDRAAEAAAEDKPETAAEPAPEPVFKPRPTPSTKIPQLMADLPDPIPTEPATAAKPATKETTPMPQKPRPDTATYSLDFAHIFPYYQTREDYEKATGKTCPPYNDIGRPKYWEGTVEADADPDLSIRFMVAYNSRGGVAKNADGTPKPSFLDLKPEEVVRVNIPPKGVGSFPGTTSGVEIQPPIELLPNEKLEFQTGIASAQLRIRNTNKTPTVETMSERQLLEGIYKAVVAKPV